MIYPFVLSLVMSLYLHFTFFFFIKAHVYNMSTFSLKFINIFCFLGPSGPRVTIPRSLRWAACGAVTVSSSTALLVRLFSPECEPQNIAAYDKKK